MSCERSTKAASIRILCRADLGWGHDEKVRFRRNKSQMFVTKGTSLSAGGTSKVSRTGISENEKKKTISK